MNRFSYLLYSYHNECWHRISYRGLNGIVPYERAVDKTMKVILLKTFVSQCSTSHHWSINKNNKITLLLAHVIWFKCYFQS